MHPLPYKSLEAKIMPLELPLELPQEALDQLHSIMFESAKKAFNEASKQVTYRPYMTKEECASYLHVSKKTLNDFIKQGLKVTVIDNIQRISKNEADNFYKQHLI